MGRQINYFGGREAFMAILDSLADMRPLFFPVRPQNIQSLHINEIISQAETSEQALSFVVVSPPRVAELVWSSTNAGGYQIDFDSSPALELTPAVIQDAGSVAREGRIYVSFNDQQLAIHLQRLRRLVATKCRQLDLGHSYWLFPEVQSVQYLDPLAGRRINNPYNT